MVVDETTIRVAADAASSFVGKGKKEEDRADDDGGGRKKTQSGGNTNNDPMKRQSAKKKKKKKTKQQQTTASFDEKEKGAAPPRQQQQRAKPKAKSAPTPAAVASLCVDPPLECSRSDFDALLDDAANLADVAEASAELLDCARYGEVEACRAILDVWSCAKKKTKTKTKGDDDDDDGDNIVPIPPSSSSLSVLDAADSSQSTPLHRACANGHESTVRLLLSRGAQAHVRNDSGNTPLHWAAGAGHEGCVALLLDHYDALEDAAAASRKGGGGGGGGAAMDVLAKNDFGRSALTEGFASGNTKVVNLLLNHDSAEEDKLIGGLDKEDVNDEDEAEDVAQGGGDGGGKAADDDVAKKAERKKKEKEGIVHEFDFARGNEEEEEGVVDGGEEEGRIISSVLIRELPIAHADDPFGQAPVEDTTGLGIWCASLVMARWLASPSMRRRMEGRTVLELGAGCGVPGLTTAICARPRSVTMTDLNPETIDNLRHNIELNGCDARTVTAGAIDWGDESTYPPHKLDYVVCSDCIYQKDIVPLLKKVVAGLLDPNHGTFLYVAPEGGRDGLPEFIAAMKAEGFECVREEAAPKAYGENPLKSGDEEDCFLHFHELAGTVYVLYEFRRC